MSIVVCRDLCRFALALPSLLFLSYSFLVIPDGVQAAHYDFDRCPRGGGLRPENPSPCTLESVYIPKISVHSAENERFLLAFPSWFFSAHTFDVKPGHSPGRG